MKNNKEKKNKVVIVCSVLIATLIVISISLWGLLLFGTEKGAEDSWAIGIGLFGSLAGGIFTLIAVLIPINETRQIQKRTEEMHYEQLRLNILNDYIIELNNIIEILEVMDKVTENMKIHMQGSLNTSFFNVHSASYEEFLKLINELYIKNLYIKDNNLRNEIESKILFITADIEEFNKNKGGYDECQKVQDGIKAIYGECNNVSKMVAEEIKRVSEEKYSLIK